MKNEKYVGDALLQKTITKNFKKKRNKGEAPKYCVKDTHPGIVLREDYEKAQELMVIRAKSKGNKKGRQHIEVKTTPRDHILWSCFFRLVLNIDKIFLTLQFEFVIITVSVK